jgi:hypothetical protein
LIPALTAASDPQRGILSQNEIRKKENLSPIPGGDKYLEPLNMTVGTSDLRQPGN